MLPSPPVAEGQTEAFASVPHPLGLDPESTYQCRECYSRLIVGPVARTVDPRWVVATCMDCGDRVICTVTPKASLPIPSQEDTNGESNQG